MRRAVAVVLLVVLLGPVAVAAPTPTPVEPSDASPSTATTGPRIVAVYPNPALHGDRGEYVVLSVPNETAGPLTLTDGESTVSVPIAGLAGRVAVATDPAASNLTDRPVVVVEGPLRLANDGETVELRVGGRRVDSVAYPRAPEGSLYRRTASGWTWQRLGATSFPVRTADDATARLFVLPDAPAAALEPLRRARDRLWLAAYTLTSRRVVRALCDARARGVDTRVLVELDPVGGMTAAGADRLDRLVDCGVAVRAIGGSDARYAFHHAKYAVADGRAVVLTENWKPSGVGGRSSRGWGVVVRDGDVAAALTETFEADAGWRDSRPWRAARAGRTFDRLEPPANGSYPAVLGSTTVAPVDVEVLVAPDNAERRVVGLLDGATASVRVVQVSVGGPAQPFVRALVRAARRGVDVRLLLSDAWFVREHNRAVADALNGLARAEGLPLRVRLASPRGRYEKVHAKGAVVDGERVLVGSLNWNNASARRNREVALVLHGEAAGAYYARAFDADWRGGRWWVPVSVPAVAAVLVVVGTLLARRTIAFESREDEGVRPVEPEGASQEPY